MIAIDNPVIEITAGNTSDSTAKEIFCNLQVLYGTRAGEQAMDRDFGIDWTATGYPMEHAKSLLAAEYVRKTQKYEPRARVSRVDWAGDPINGSVTAKVVIQLV